MYENFIEHELVLNKYFMTDLESVLSTELKSSPMMSIDQFYQISNETFVIKIEMNCIRLKNKEDEDHTYLLKQLIDLMNEFYACYYQNQSINLRTEQNYLNHLEKELRNRSNSLLGSSSYFRARMNKDRILKICELTKFENPRKYYGDVASKFIDEFVAHVISLINENKLNELELNEMTNQSNIILKKVSEYFYKIDRKDWFCFDINQFNEVDFNQFCKNSLKETQAQIDFDKEFIINSISELDIDNIYYSSYSRKLKNDGGFNHLELKQIHVLTSKLFESMKLLMLLKKMINGNEYHFRDKELEKISKLNDYQLLDFLSDCKLELPNEQSIQLYHDLQKQTVNKIVDSIIEEMSSI